MPDLLKKYRTMRDFGDTPEPSGGKPKKTKLPIFVIQKHHASHLHYDFRLEMEGVLKSWAVPKGPSYDPTIKRLAMMTEDHPYDYASFEGVIPAGNYGGGNVIIWDNGTWEFIEPGDDPVKALQVGQADVPDVRQEDVRRVGAGEDQGPLAAARATSGCCSSIATSSRTPRST